MAQPTEDWLRGRCLARGVCRLDDVRLFASTPCISWTTVAAVTATQSDQHTELPGRQHLIGRCSHRAASVCDEQCARHTCGRVEPVVGTADLRFHHQWLCQPRVRPRNNITRVSTWSADAWSIRIPIPRCGLSKHRFRHVGLRGGHASFTRRRSYSNYAANSRTRVYRDDRRAVWRCATVCILFDSVDSDHGLIGCSRPSKHSYIP